MSNRLKKKATPFSAKWQDAVYIHDHVKLPFRDRVKILFKGGFWFSLQAPTQRRIGKVGNAQIAITHDGALERAISERGPA
jgi:hypothetical protein